MVMRYGKFTVIASGLGVHRIGDVRRRKGEKSERMQLCMTRRPLPY